MKFSFFLSATIFLISLLEYIKSTHTSTHMFTKTGRKGKKNLKKKKRPVDMVLPEAQIYWQGWVKYFHYNNNTHYDVPPSLFQNNAYYHQRIHINKIKERDEFGLINIPNKASFYLVVYNSSISIYSMRHEIVDHLIDSLSFENIQVIPEDAWMKGGIRNDGDFAFGSCMELKADIPVSRLSKMTNPQIWIVCANTNKDKFRLMKYMIKLKINQQRLSNNNIKLLKGALEHNKPKSLGGLVANPTGKPRTAQSVKNPADGYWILLNDWTLCNKKCGGGLQFQQWMCVPPKSGGKPCKGPAVRTKKCNEQPCPSVNNLLTLTQKNDRFIAPKPIVKVGPFSNRPQRYSKCYVKENDAFINEFEKISKTWVKRPIRIVMNNHTISIFKDDTYQEMAFTFELAKTKFVLLNKLCCFEIEDSYKNATICSYDSECDKVNNNWANTWSEDFKLFKYQCHTGLQSGIITPADEESIEDKLNSDMSEAQLETANQQAAEVKKQQLGKQIRKYEKKQKKVEDTGFKVLSKEIELENMVQKEEQEKEENEQKKMEAKIAVEKKKAECLEKSFEERQLDDEFQETEKQSIEDENDIKLQTQKKVEEGRWKLRKKLQLMKVKAKQKKQNISNQLNMIRTKMSKEIILANKNGDIKVCKRGMKDADFRENYCNKAFIEDWERNSECKSNNEFCYTCCENEFGINFVSQRDSCYNWCDKKPKKKVEFPKVNGKEIIKPPAKPDQGRWVWAPKEKTDSANLQAK